MFLRGAVQSFGVVLISAFFFVYISLLSKYYAIDAVVFTVMSMMATAFSLSILAGPGKYVASTLKSWETWFYGVLLIGTYILDIILVKTVSGTEAGLLNRLTIPFAILFALIFLKRKPSKFHIIGNLIIISGFALLLQYQSIEVWQAIWIPTLLVVLFNGGSFIVAETHKEYANANKIGNLRDRMRVLAFVSFVTSMIFLGSVFFITVAKENISFLQSLVVLDFIPNREDYLHFPSILSGILYGLFLAPAARYMVWASSQSIKSENVLAILSMIPIVTLLMEGATVWLTGSAWEIDMLLVGATILISFGAMLPVILQLKNEAKLTNLPLWKAIQSSVQLGNGLTSINYSNTAFDDYEIVCATLEHTHGDEIKAAELLNITADTIHVLHEGKGSLALASHASQEVSRRYRNQVANRDTLTGLLNRGGFMAEAKKLLEKSEQDNQQASLLFIDLDKFKPVNDTYGHDAGDFILKGVAERLTALFTGNNGGKSGSNSSMVKASLVTRLGGDEFCVLLAGSDKKYAQKQAKLIQKEIAKPFNFKGKKIIIGASVGIASYPEHGRTTEELLKHADESMYDEKKVR